MNNTMKKKELVAAVAEKTGLSKKDTEAVIASTFDVIVEAVASGDAVQLIGFGTFEPRVRNEKMGQNPRTGEPMTIPAATVPAFKAGKAFKDKVNQ